MQTKAMVCLRQVQATTKDARSRFGDDSEERNPLFFHRELLILLDHGRREISLASPARPVVIPPGLKARVIRLNSAEYGSLPGVRGNG